jgi:hypothetical protein
MSIRVRLTLLPGLVLAALALSVILSGAKEPKPALAPSLRSG